MRKISKISAILLASLLLGLGGVANAQPDTDPILRLDSDAEIELDLAVMVDDMMPLLMEALAVDGEEGVAAANLVTDLLGVDALRRLHMKSQANKDESSSRITITLDPDIDGGILAELFAIPERECQFDQFVPMYRLMAFSVMHNFPAYLEVMLDLLARPELADLTSDLPLNDQGEISIAGFTPRTDLLPLLSGELDLVMLEAPSGAMMSPQQFPFFLVLGSHDGRLLRDKLLELAALFGGDDASQLTTMLEALPAEEIGDFELKEWPMGGAFAVSDDFLVLGPTAAPLREILGDAHGDLAAPDGLAWTYMNGEKYGNFMESMMNMVGNMAPGDAEETRWMSRLYSVLLPHLETYTELVTASNNRLLIENETHGPVMTGLYRMLLAAMTELPAILEQKQLEAAKHQEASGYRDIIAILDASMTEYGLDHDGMYPADPRELVAEGYLDSFPLEQAVPAGTYVEGGYTYHALRNAEGDIAGYFLFVYGGGEGTGHDVYTTANIHTPESFVVDSDGRPDGIASFCYDGLALEQVERWRQQ